jgi:hypothetical protein
MTLVDPQGKIRTLVADLLTRLTGLHRTGVNKLPHLL